MCGKEFANPQSFNGHKSHCKEHHLGKFGNLNSLNKMKKGHLQACQRGRQQYVNNREIEKQQHMQKWIIEQHKCENCGEVMTKYYGSGRFCSRSCANKRSHSEETKKKISESMKNVDITPLHKGGYKQRTTEEGVNPSVTFCRFCGNIIQNNNKAFCNNSCKTSFYRANLTNKKAYWGLCKFTFNLSLYPKYFDMQLIIRYGMYSASNRGNNLNGVSRDHLFSVKQGFVLGVDPYYISHPANCKLVLHKTNQKKNDKCSISIQELIKRVEQFNLHYGDYPNNLDYSLLPKDYNIKIKYKRKEIANENQSRKFRIEASN